MSMSNDYDAGMGTTPGMWEMVSELLDGEKLPASVSEATHSACAGSCHRSNQREGEGQ